MAHYISQQQQKIEEFGNVYQLNLNPQNRWVQFAAHLPWNNLVEIFSESFSDKVKAIINLRIVLGSLIIKHKLSLSDEETILQIEENLTSGIF